MPKGSAERAIPLEKQFFTHSVFPNYQANPASRIAFHRNSGDLPRHVIMRL
jgi:hypothetical protein